ncbi:ABC transporter permease [Treponema sp. JC4]|uniref:ABC transporter permease n=1 Tax=Treponema sp. JC4 TaxID=1124982 RepID=UPI00178C2043|nr:FtsX-like permease family protein [Treponema sp. JC4]
MKLNLQARLENKVNPINITENIGFETTYSIPDDTTWNFIICDVEDNSNISSVIKKLNKTFRRNGWNVEAVNWRSAAGSTAMYLYFLRLILNIGIIVVLFAGFIIINNTLVVNILDRTQEIGTMRAIGTSKLFVSLQCMSETLLLALTAGFLGLIFGAILSHIVNDLHITFTNAFLIQLFGGNTLVTVVKASNLAKCFLVSSILGMFAWIYPVHTALITSPVTAMTGAR